VDRTQLAVAAAREGPAGSLIGLGRDGVVVANHHEEAADHRNDLEQVFRAEYVRVIAIAQRVLGDRDAAQDVAQEVFLGFARSQVDRSAAGRWLAVAAVHTALNSVRSDRRRAGRELRVQFDPALGRSETAGDAADDAVRSLERARVRRALAALPRNQAVALVLRHSGVSYADIADALGIAPSGVGTTVRRAEAALRKELTSVDASF
jgi:RNA polymerase sigma-70 factor (ECF subfamily)